jgi:hypothetical protein
MPSEGILYRRRIDRPHAPAHGFAGRRDGDDLTTAKSQLSRLMAADGASALAAVA